MCVDEVLVKGWLYLVSADETEHVQRQQSVCLSLLLQALRLEQTALKNLNIEADATKFQCR